MKKNLFFRNQGSDFIKKILLTNNFQKLYSDRYVSSIYIDNLNFDSAKDNINGINERKKLRFRWYNDNFDNIYFEKKNKNNFFVWKNIQKIDLNFSKKNLVNKIYDLLLNDNNILI